MAENPRETSPQNHEVGSTNMFLSDFPQSGKEGSSNSLHHHKKSRWPFSKNKSLLLTVVAITSVLGLATLISSFAKPLYDDSFKAAEKNNFARGLNYNGLRKTTKNHPCKGSFEVKSKNGSSFGCTHGPDSFRSMIQKPEVTIPEISDQQINAIAKAKAKSIENIGKASNNNKLNQEQMQDKFLNGVKSELDKNITSTTSLETPKSVLSINNSYAPLPVKCVGSNGHEGKRVQAVYAYFEDSPNLYAANKPFIQNLFIPLTEAYIYNESWSGPGSTARRIRWVTEDGSCLPRVLQVRLPMRALYDFGEMSTYLHSIGLTSTDRKYLVYTDTAGRETGYCGIAYIPIDSRPTSDNLSNRSNWGISRIDPACWDGSTELHELFHNFGAVQEDAPNSTNPYTDDHHCIDEWDLMCYPDGADPRLAPMKQPCTAPVLMPEVLDCNSDDYFSTKSTTGYLSTHWNSANSMFMYNDGAAKPRAVGIAHTGGNDGYWIVTGDGGIKTFGNAAFHGSVPGRDRRINNASGMKALDNGRGYYIFTTEGEVFAFGDAVRYGSLVSDDKKLFGYNKIVDMAIAPDKKGYWLLGFDGSVHAYGSARFEGSVRKPLTPDWYINEYPQYKNYYGKVMFFALTIEARSDNRGYMVYGRDYIRQDGEWIGRCVKWTFGPGDEEPQIVSRCRDVDNRMGQVLVESSDFSKQALVRDTGTVTALGSTVHQGDLYHTVHDGFIIDAQMTPSGLGYWLMTSKGRVYAFGNARHHGNL